MIGMEWVVLYWTGTGAYSEQSERNEKRFRDRNTALRFIMALHGNSRVHLDCVNQGESVMVR